MTIASVRRVKVGMLLGTVLYGCGKTDAPAVAPKAQAATGPAATAGSPEKEAPRTSAGAATPEELVARFDAAVRSDDTEAMAVLFASPVDAIIREKARVNNDVRAKVAALEKEITARFGPRKNSDDPPFGSLLAEKVLQDSFSGKLPGNRKNPRTTIVSKEAQADSLVTLKVDTTVDIDGKPHTETATITAIHSTDGWKFIAPKGDVKLGELPEDLKLLIGQIETATTEVRDGLFNSRAEVDELVASYLVSYMPGVLMQAEYDPLLKGEAEHLHLMKPEVPISDGPTEAVTVTVYSEGEGDKARLSVGSTDKEILIDQMDKEVTQVATDLVLPPHYPVRVVIRKGTRENCVLGVLHMLVGLRTEPLSPQIGLAAEDHEEFLAVVNKANGRLRLLFIDPPKYESPLKLEVDGLLQQQPSLSEIADELGDALKRPSELTIEPQTEIIELEKSTVPELNTSEIETSLPDEPLPLEAPKTKGPKE